VQGADDFEAIGFSELLEQGAIVVVEWAQRIAPLLPANRISIVIEPIDERRRQINVTMPG
jgi:tRNA A37 threonylcarbamoyladenosine biosynthesis protein TsaE